LRGHQLYNLFDALETIILDIGTFRTMKNTLTVLIFM